MRRCLLLVDLQNDFLAAPGLDPVPDRIIERAAALLAACRRAGVPVLHARTTVTRAADERMPHWRAADRWDCVEGTDGHRFPAALAPGSPAAEPVFDKVFFSAFTNPELGPALAALGAEELILAGVHLHGCVRATALDAYARGLRVTIAADATGSYDGLHSAVSRRWLSARGFRFASAAQLAAELALDPRSEPTAAEPPDLAAEAAAAVARAKAAGGEWSVVPAGDRARVLALAAELLASEAERMAALITAEVGKPIHYSRLEVGRGVALLEVAARLRPPADAPTPEATVRRVPVGVVAQITPWNNPLAVPIGKLAPALALGNTVAWKPSPLAPGTADALAELLGRAGLPAGAVAIAHGGAETAEALAGSHRVAAVSLTGGSAAGYAAQAICAARRVPLQAELGGNNGAIVWSDCELEAAAAAIAEAGFGCAGQRCTANRRVIVDRRVLVPFAELLSVATAALPIGSPLDSATRIGPLVRAEARERIAAMLERAAAEAEVRRPAGAPARLGTLPAAGRYLEPAIVIDPAPGSEVVQRESFGPVVVVQPADDFAHALELLNGVEEGLVAALFSGSEPLRERFLAEARAGVLKLGRATADVGVETPFGGWGSSGVGPPEHGEANLEFYTRRQALYRA